MKLSDRLLKIAAAAAGKGLEEVEKLIHNGTTLIDKELEDLEKKLNIDKENNKENNGGIKKEGVNKASQEEEDLGLFHLKEGASWDEVKKAYRREVKKYHADKHNHDDGKKGLAHEIMLIYNSAYERLEKYYGKT